MKADNILDQEEPAIIPNDPGLRRRAIRFLVYCLGIIGVLWYRVFYAVDAAQTSGDLNLPTLEVLSRRIIPIGTAAIWLFSGLGMVSVIKALRTSRLDLGWILLGIAHVGLFLMYSASLLFYFVGLFP